MSAASDTRQYERSLLAAALLEPSVLDLLDLEDLTDGLVYEAWKAAAAIRASGGRPDLPTVGASLPERAPELAVLSGESPSAANAPFYAKCIVAAAKARRARRILEEGLEALDRGEVGAIARVTVSLARLEPSGAEPSSFRFVRADTMEAKAPDWLARGYFVRDSLIILFGQYGSLKSFVVFDLAFSVAAGIAWQGARVAQGAVLIILGEGFGGATLRRRAWELAHGVSLAGMPIYFSTSCARLGDPTFQTELERAVKAAVDEAGELALVVVDTWSRNLAGDENATLDSAAAVRALDAIRAVYHAAIFVVHHEGWTTGRTRGSTVLMAAADTAYRIEKGTDDVARFTAEKTKDGRAPDPLAFRIRDVDLGIVDDEGKPLSSAIIERIEYTAIQPIKTPSGKRQREVLDILETEIEKNRDYLSKAGRDPDTARVSFEQWKAASLSAGIERRRFSDAKAALLDTGAVISISGGFAAPAAAAGSAGLIDRAAKPARREEGKPDKPDINRTKTGAKPAAEVRGANTIAAEWDLCAAEKQLDLLSDALEKGPSKAVGTEAGQLW